MLKSKYPVDILVSEYVHVKCSKNVQKPRLVTGIVFYFSILSYYHIQLKKFSGLTAGREMC